MVVGWFKKLKTSLSKSSDKISGGIKKILKSKKIDESTLQELEELMISSDLGVESSSKIIQELKKSKLLNPSSEKVKEIIKKKLKETLAPLEKKIDLILSPAMGGIIIGYDIGRLLKKETIFSERVNGQFKLRRDFSIKKDEKVLIIEDVITTGKSSLECSKLATDFGASIVGYACIIDRSNNKSLIKDKIISQIQLNIPTYTEENLPKNLSTTKAVKPGSRNL